MVNNLFANARFARDLGSILGWGRSPEVEDGTRTPVFLPGKFYQHRSLVGYSQWGCKCWTLLRNRNGQKILVTFRWHKF